MNISYYDDYIFIFQFISFKLKVFLNGNDELLYMFIEISVIFN